MTLPGDTTGELSRLFWAVRDGQCSSEDLARLENLLRERPDLRQSYIRFTMMCGMLRYMRASSLPADPPNEVPIPPMVLVQPHGLLAGSIHTSGGLFSSGWPVAYLIATIVFAVGLTIAAIVHVSQPDKYVTPRNSVHTSNPQSPIPNPSSIVARVTGMVDCVWTGDGTKHSPLSSLPSPLVALGDRLALRSGLLEITYDTGARVILQGPVTYEVESPTGGYLSVGKLTARLEKGSKTQQYANPKRQRGARGEDDFSGSANQKSEILNQKSPDLCPLTSDLFAIRTPTAIVTDLGTEFGVEVDKQGDTASHVFRGEVEFRAQNADGDQQPIRLTENQSAWIESDGNRVATVSRDAARAKTFVRAMPAPPRRVPIKLFNTGQDVKDGSPDPNWQIVAASNDPAFKPRAAMATKPLSGSWMANEPGESKWISAVADSSPMPNNATYTFRNSFDLAGLRPQTARLHGQFIADDRVRAIRLNGHNVRVPDHDSGQSDFFHPFTIGSGFVDGVNVLEIDVENGRSESSPASVRNVHAAGDTTLFHDDFESTSSASAAPFPDKSGNYDPTGGRPGCWAVTETSPSAVQVTTSVVTPDPGPYQGAKYLRLRRVVHGKDEASARAAFAAPVIPGDRLRIAAAVYVPAVEQQTAEIVQITVGGAINLIANYRGGRSVASRTNDAVSHDTGLNFTAGKWQRWQIDYDVGATTCTLAIDGRSASNIPVSTVDFVKDAEFWATPFAANPIYVDDVLVLATSGPMGLRVELEGTAQQR